LPKPLVLPTEIEPCPKL